MFGMLSRFGMARAGRMVGLYFCIRMIANAYILSGSSYILNSIWLLCQHFHGHRLAHPAAQGQQDDHEDKKKTAHGDADTGSV